MRTRTERKSAAEIPRVLYEDLLKRLVVALAAFFGLGVLSWTTLSDQRIRLVTLAILAMFAFKTWVHRKDVIDVGDKGK